MRGQVIGLLPWKPVVLNEDQFEQRARRIGWWLRVARESRGLKLAGVATGIGLSANSASTISAWEEGSRQPSLRQLAQLAVLYDVPFTLFTDPPSTDEERLERYRADAAGAVALEQQDWEQGSEALRPLAAAPDASRDKRSA
jgi:transcriptional regulator with XRE-family HTH domain